MQKYAFIENVPGLSVDDYMTSFDDGEWINYIIGVDGINACLDKAREMMADGCSLINLCGDFGPEHVAELMKDAPDGTRVCYAAYLPEEQKKMEALEQYIEYGQIILGANDEPVQLDLEAPEMNTHTVFVKDMDQTITAAQNFAKAGVDGIELCSGYDLDMTKQIIAAVEAIDPRIPVGSNGIDQ